MAQLQWGFIGFGEAGSTFASHIAERLGRPIYVLDPVLNSTSIPVPIQERLDITRCEIMGDIVSLMARCDVVVSMVTPRVASVVANQAAKVWKRGVYIDFNSVSPSEKQAMAVLFPKDVYIDGAVLGSVTQERASVPLAVAGAHAGRTSALLRKVGLTVIVAGTQVGAASAVKMCRSVFMKGLECLFVETLLAASKFESEGPVLESIEQTFQSYDFRSLMQMLVTTHAIHCARRSDEMHSVTRMMSEIGVPIHMARAARNFLRANARTGLPAHFRGKVPDKYSTVISYLRDSYGREQ
jgi:3-hydroxyisobutyrate dehydrogenase-like beta-hydroxyacid dehydrogenase